MPAEPIEAEFAFPPALSRSQEEEYRQLGREGPLTRHPSLHTITDITLSVHDLEKTYTKEGFHVVEFEPGAGEDPREWSKSRKWFITAAASFLCLAVALGSSIITGDLEGPTEDFHAPQEVINLTVTFFVMGFGIGPLLFAPLSEVFGRKPIYCISMFLYFIFTLPAPLARNRATLIVSRALAGLAASAPMCNVGGTIADVWAIEDRGIPMAIFSATLFMGPCLGPVFGGWIGQKVGWRWIYWVLFIFVGLCFVFTLFFSETLASILLRRKAEKLRKETGDDLYQSLGELERLPLPQTLKVAISRPLIMLFTEPIVMFMSFYLSFIYALLYLLFFAFPIAFQEIRGWSGGMTGTTFVSIIIGISIALCIMPYQERMYAKVTADGTFPEARLYPMMVGAFVLPVALFLFAFTGAYPWVHWMGVCVSGAVFGFAMIIVYISANSYIVDSYSSFAASAIAAKTLLRSCIGASVPLFVEQMFHSMGFQFAGLLLALVACVISPIPFIFYRYGERIRLSTQPPGPVILLGHSMGGLLAAEAATHASNNAKGKPSRIVGMVAFDTPYLGMHPHVVISGIASLFNEKETTNKGLNDTHKVALVDSSVTDDWETFKQKLSPRSKPATISTLSNISSLPSSLLDRATSFVSSHSDDPFVRWARKHSDHPFSASKRWVVEHFQFGSCMFDPSGLKDRYTTLVGWQGGLWINYWTQTVRRSNSAASGANGDAMIDEITSESMSFSPLYQGDIKYDNKGQAEKVKSGRHFIVLPTGLPRDLGGSEKWEKVIIGGVDDEVAAHCGLFIRGQNLDYEGLVARVGQRVLEWCEKI
ncbi:hypothetical protein H0H92_013537 [Tricholoma furcatifolium]|nr:hypothetical protein H0H92_013537 [Tricholoma furcatifolium]